MVNDSILNPDVNLLRRGYEYLKGLEMPVEKERSSLLADLQTQLDKLIPPGQPLPDSPRTGWSCPNCAGQLALMFEALVSTAIDIDKRNGSLLWGSERPDDSYYQPAFDCISADVMCMSCSEIIKFPDSTYISLAKSDYTWTREMPSAKKPSSLTLPAALAFPQYSPLSASLHLDTLYHEPENTPHDPHTFRLSASDRLALAWALEQERHHLFAGALANVLFAGRGTLEVVGCASLLKRLASALSSLLPVGDPTASLRLEIEGRLEELFPSAPALDASLAQLFSCAFCGGTLHVCRRGQECTCVVIDQNTGRLVRGSATLTDDYFGRPSFYVCDADVVCAACYKHHSFLEYEAYRAGLVFTCVVCKASCSLGELKSVRPTVGHTHAPLCETCERT